MRRPGSPGARPTTECCPRRDRVRAGGTGVDSGCQRRDGPASCSRGEGGHDRQPDRCRQSPPARPRLRPRVGPRSAAWATAHGLGEIGSADHREDAARGSDDNDREKRFLLGFLRGLVLGEDVSGRERLCLEDLPQRGSACGRASQATAVAARESPPRARSTASSSSTTPGCTSPMSSSPTNPTLAMAVLTLVVSASKLSAAMPSACAATRAVEATP